MNVQLVMTEIATQLKTITGLKVYDFPADKVSPPAAIVVLPDEVLFDQTYGRGMDRMTIPLLVVVGRQSDRASSLRIAGYLSGSGTTSIKATIEAKTSWTNCDEAVVTRGEFDVAEIAGTEYFAALFDIDVVGDGT